MVKNKENIFYKPIKLKEISFFFRRNNLNIARIIIIIPKYVIKSSRERNHFKRIIRNFILGSNISRVDLDIVFFLHKINGKNSIFYILNNVWKKLF
jgi:ribonuclease P protein component